MLAYKLQEQAYGGPKPEVKRRLRELTASFHWDPKETTARRADPLWIKPGTMLIRQWEGQTPALQSVRTAWSETVSATEASL